MKILHCFGHRVGLIAEQGATVALCGARYEDKLVEVYKEGIRPQADLSEFATDGQATCRVCLKRRQKLKPGFWKRLWRKLTGYEEWETSTPIRVAPKADQ